MSVDTYSVSGTGQPFRHTLPPPPQRPVAASQCYQAYAASIVMGALTWLALTRFAPANDPFSNGLMVTVVATFVIYVFSIRNDNSSIYDPYWVIAPPLLALGIKADSAAGFGAWHPRDVLIVFCLLFWATRYHVFYAWDGWKTGLSIEDWRYENMRSFPGPYWLHSLLGMHYFPTFLVYFAFAPAALVLGTAPLQQPELGFWDLVGVAGAVSATLIQYVADRQCADFRRSAAYEHGATIRTGLWKYSRHPNYFGEVLFWCSMIPFALGAGLFSDHALLILAGPIAMGVFFRFSAWLMDVRSLERRPDFQTAIDETSAMLPWWPKRSDS